MPETVNLSKSVQAVELPAMSTRYAEPLPKTTFPVTVRQPGLLPGAMPPPVPQVTLPTKVPLPPICPPVAEKPPDEVKVWANVFQVPAVILKLLKVLLKAASKSALPDGFANSKRLKTPVPEIVWSPVPTNLT